MEFVDFAGTVFLSDVGSCKLPPSPAAGVASLGHSGHLTLSEVHLYRSSRLGIQNVNRDMQVATTAGNTNFETGNKFFELSNHLGNVLATITDKKRQHSSNGTTVDYYYAEVATATDYYPFGMALPGRTVSSSSYRYGFNGKEKDKDMNSLTAYDYGFRIYNPAIGKFLSVDPLSKDFPFFTPYQFSGNNPIKFVDLDGAEQFDPSSKPTGITLLNKATAPGVASQTKSIYYKNYEFRGIWGVNGEGYWIARYHFPEGKYKGMYNDEYVIGTDALYKFIYDIDKYHDNYEWAQEFGTREDFTARNIAKNWVNTVKNPVNWIAGAGILAAGTGAVGRNMLRTEANALEGVVARGISGRTFTEAEISNVLKSGSKEEMMTLYRGVSGKESSTATGSGTLFLTEDAKYAAAYAKENGLTVQQYQVSRSGFNQLKNENLITSGSNNGVLVDRAGKTIATGGEISTSNEAVKKVILNSKSN